MRLEPADLASDWSGERPLLCIAGRSVLDEAASLMMAHLATSHGIAAEAKPADALSTTNIFRLETEGVAAVCLIYLDVGAVSHMRYAVRRLCRKLPTATIILCCWAEDIDQQTLEQLRSGTKVDLAVASPGEALAACVRLAAADGPEPSDNFASDPSGQLETGVAAVAS